MPSVIRSPKNLWSGIFYIAFGAGAVILSFGYSIGTAMRMGPGFFPTLLGLLLIVIGGLSILRGLRADGDDLEAMSWRPVFFVIASIAAFAFLLQGAGFLIALAALLALAPAASRFARYTPIGVALALLLIAACSGLFVLGLGLPLPLVGRWFS